MRETDNDTDAQTETDGEAEIDTEKDRQIGKARLQTNDTTARQRELTDS